MRLYNYLNNLANNVYPYINLAVGVCPRDLGNFLESTFCSPPPTPPPAAFCLKLPEILQGRSLNKKCPKWSPDTPPKRIFPGKFVFSRYAASKLNRTTTRLV